MERTFNRRPAQNLLRLHIALKATFSVHQLQANMEFTSACFFKSWLLNHPCRSWWFVTSVVFSRKKNEVEKKVSWLNQRALHCSAAWGTLNYHLAHITISRMLKYPAMRHMNFFQTAWVLLQNERAKLTSSWTFWDLRYIEHGNRNEAFVYSEITVFYSAAISPGIRCPRPCGCCVKSNSTPYESM